MTKRNCTTQVISKQAKKPHPRLISQDEFVNRSIKVHGDAYDYSKSVYINCSTNIEIICKKCGQSFFQLPSNHWKGYRCTHCYGTMGTTTADFIKKARAVHGNRYNYSKVKYRNGDAKVLIVCTQHGEFKQRPADHISGKGCQKCANELTSRKLSMGFDDFVRKSNEAHGNKYQYNTDFYYGLNKKAGVICDIHGLFYQDAKAHMHGKGCRQCGFRSSGYNRNRFKLVCDKNNNGNGWFYLIKCKKDNELFYKVGITSRPLSERFKYKSHMPYDYEVIFLIEDKPVYIFNLENRIHALLKTHRYTPEIDFKGSVYECFNEIKPVESLLKELSTTKQLQLLA